MDSTLNRESVLRHTETRTTQLPSLTGMRFIAAFLVFAFHVMALGLFSSASVQSGFATVAQQAGWTGVGFFFVLSGFVLTWSARSGDTARRFWWRRFRKIYPNHLVTFLAAVLLLGWLAKDSPPAVAVFFLQLDPLHAIPNVLLIQSWFPQLEIRGAFNGPAWSLSCEALFYLSFPLLLRLISRIRPERLWAWAGGVVAAIVTIATAAVVLPGGAVLPGLGLDELEFWLIYQFPPLRMLDFVFGILLARIVMAGRRLPLRLSVASVLAVAGYAVASLVPAAFSIVAVMVAPLGLLIAAAAKADLEGRSSRLLSSRVMVWLGQVSFAFYMWHALVITYGHHWLGGGSSSVLVALGEIALLFAVTLMLSWLQFTRIERPLSRIEIRRRPRVGQVGS
jgi:peptidoglycan/LPS O-acetylase OafA/YrhL